MLRTFLAAVGLVSIALFAVRRWLKRRRGHGDGSDANEKLERVQEVAVIAMAISIPGAVLAFSTGVAWIAMIPVYLFPAAGLVYGVCQAMKEPRGE